MTLTGPVAVVPGLRARPVLTVRLDAVAHNTRLLAARAPHLMAVVKADGFGLGAVDLARTALAHGARSLGVTTLTEASALRAAGVTAPVLSWLDAPDADLTPAVLLGVDLAVPDLAHLDAVRATARRLRRSVMVHLYLDCGTARDGCPPEQWARLCAAAADAEREGTVHVVGVMGHLACAADPDDPENAAALARLTHGVAQASAAGLHPAVRHLAATAGVLGVPGSVLDLVRVGAGLAGIDPSGRTSVLRDVAHVTAPVVQVRDVPAGTGVGYDHAHRTSAPTRLALLPLGYADGLPVQASGRAEVLLHGRRRPLVGRISMDQVVVDAGDLPVAPGDVATVIGADAPAPGGADEPAPTLAEWARWADSLPHAILTGLGARLERRTVAAPSAGTDLQESR
ncbi:alanine racemase [Cellulomonas sp. B6]|uniref:alanine racemase n=1 Tax=Cellulomonas sp. B6 TaxID=1295626 RepID=UPI00073C1FCE|nr:alanine racemase [Cellulomonas sp. B6]KSW29844.1 alanine racemase [Cellulomonas sp. B6]